MKRKGIYLIIIAVILIAIGGLITVLVASCISTNLQNSEINSFDLSSYQWEIENFPYDKNVGKVENKDVAIEKAIELWSEKYGDRFFNENEFDVSYNSKDSCWHIRGILNPNQLGGMPHAIIRESGEVVAVWMDD